MSHYKLAFAFPSKISSKTQNLITLIISILVTSLAPHFVTTHCFPNVLISHPPSPNYHPSWQHQYYLDIHPKFCIVQLQIGFSHSIKIHRKFPSVIWSGLYKFKGGFIVLVLCLVKFHQSLKKYYGGSLRSVKALVKGLMEIRPMQRRSTQLPPRQGPLFG